MATNLVVNLLRRLRGFAHPNTQSQVEGILEPGSFDVLEYKENYPNSDTDYVKVRVDTMADNDTWICSRWKTEVYAEVKPEEVVVSVPVDIEDDANAIEEHDILRWLSPFMPFRYTPKNARYPYSLPGVRLTLSPPYQNNCCTFVEALVVKAWAEAVPEFVWDGENHAQMMVLSEDLFSPVTALVEKGLASAVGPDALPQPWTVIQGWRDLGRKGHTFIVVAHHHESDKVLTLESNNFYKLNGVGYRNLGNLREFPEGRAPQRWWQHPDTPTWRDIRSAYPARRQGALKVKNPLWAFED